MRRAMVSLVISRYVVLVEANAPVSASASACESLTESGSIEESAALEDQTALLDVNQGSHILTSAAADCSSMQLVFVEAAIGARRVKVQNSASDMQRERAIASSGSACGNRMECTQRAEMARDVRSFEYRGSR